MKATITEAFKDNMHAEASRDGCKIVAVVITSRTCNVYTK